MKKCQLGDRDLGNSPGSRLANGLEEGKAQTGNHGENSSKCQRYGELEQGSDGITQEKQT